MFVWEAFAVLSDDRPLGFAAPGRIPWSAMDRFARRHDIEGPDFDDFVVLIRALDSAWIEEMRRRSKEDAERRGGRHGGPTA